jgi:uroporphyrinogen decarboxylase
MAIYGRIVERYHWDALSVFWPWSDPDGVWAAKATFGDDIAIGGMVGGALVSIETVDDWMEFAVRMADDRAAVLAESEKRCQDALRTVTVMAESGADFVYIPADVAFNGGPFVSPADFAEICAPYLARIVAHARACGLIAIYHSDGNLDPVLDQILACAPHCLMSIDPMAGMDIAAVKRRTQGRMALMGNVQCSLLQDGPPEAIERSARYCLEHAAPGGGYVFSTSNTIFKGMPLANYEFMLDVFRRHNRERARKVA